MPRIELSLKCSFFVCVNYTVSYSMYLHILGGRGGYQYNGGGGGNYGGKHKKTVSRSLGVKIKINFFIINSNNLLNRMFKQCN